MRSNPNQLSTIRFSLRWALAAVTLVAVGALALTPWVRSWNAQQVWWAALLAGAVIAGLLLGVALTLGLRRRAQRRAGSLAGIVREGGRSVSVTFWIMAINLAGSVIFSLWSISGTGESPGRTRLFNPLLHFGLPFEFAFVTVVCWAQKLSVEVRESGLVVGCHFRTWKHIKRYRWDNENVHLELTSYGRTFVGQVAEAERPQVAALLHREVDASLK